MLFSLLSAYKFFGIQLNDDSVDQLHYFVTANIVLLCAIVTSFKQFGGKPIECMVPDTFPPSWEEYTENFCFVNDTFYQPFDETVPSEHLERQKGRIKYYQWVPFFLLFQAACFRLPSFLWGSVSKNSGINISELVRMANDPENIKSETRKESLEALTSHLQNALRFQTRIERRGIRPDNLWLIFNAKAYSYRYLTVMYLVTKVIYLCNIALQLNLMTTYLTTRGITAFGISGIMDLISGNAGWQTSGLFPRVTLCDFTVRVMANVQNYSVQCVLVINMFNEKIFILLYLWFLTLALVTLLSMVYWILATMLPCAARSFVQRHLELSDLPFETRSSETSVRRFTSTYLRTDGVFTLRMIAAHCCVVFTTELVVSLYRAYFGIEHKKRMHEIAIGPKMSTVWKKSAGETMARKRPKSAVFLSEYDTENEQISTCDNENESTAALRKNAGLYKSVNGSIISAEDSICFTPK